MVASISVAPLRGEKSGQHGSKLDLKTEPKLNKIEAKLAQRFEASWVLFFERFLEFWKGQWNQVGQKGTNSQSNLENAEQRKSNIKPIEL